MTPVEVATGSAAIADGNPSGAVRGGMVRAPRRRRGASLLRSYATLTLLAAAGPAAAQEAPAPEVVEQMLVEALPPYWTIGSFGVVAVTRGGDAAVPEVAMRFEAEAASSAPLYVGTAVQGPFDVVMPGATVRIGDEPTGTAAVAERTLYGVARLTYRAGEWTGEVDVENPVNALGMPLLFFARPTLILGTPEGEERLALVHDHELETLVARQDAELEELNAAHVAAREAVAADGDRTLAALRASQANEARTLARQQERDLADTAAEHAATIAARERALDDDLAALEQVFLQELSILTDETAPQLAAAREAAAERLATTQTEAEAARTEARAANEAELDALRQAHAAARGALIESQETEIARLETRLATRQKELADQIKAATGIIDQQDRLTNQLETIERNMEQLGAAQAEMVRTRSVALDALSGRWEGTASCGRPAAVASSAPACPQTISAAQLSTSSALVCTCEAGRPAGLIWGDRIYTTDSDTCTAALHAEAIAAGGTSAQVVMIKAEAGQQSYSAARRNDVSSSAYGAWSSSFRFVTDELLRLRAMEDEARPANVWSVSFTTAEAFGKGWRGTFVNEVHDQMSANATSAGTLSVAEQDGVDGAAITLALDTEGPLAGSRILDLRLGADGRLVGASRDGNCENMELSRAQE